MGFLRLSDQVNLWKWAILCRLQECGGLPALAIGGLLTRAAAVSGGQFLSPHQGDFIGPLTPSPIWNSSLGAPYSPDTTDTTLSPTLWTGSHPLLRPIVPPPASTIRFFFALSAVLTSVPGPTLPRGLQTVPGPGWPSPSFCRNCSYPPSPSASTLAGRSSSDALRAILATYPRPGRLGLGQHLPSPEPHPGWFPPLRPTLATTIDFIGR